MLADRFRFNLKFKVVGEIVARLSSLLFYAVGARLLGIEEFGLFSLAFSFASFFIVFTDLGTNSIITRNLAREKSNPRELLSTTTLFKLLLMPLLLLILHVLVSLIYGSSRMVLITDLMGLVALGIAMGEHQSAVLSGFERMEIEAYLKIIWKVGALVLSIIFFKIFHTLEWFIVGFAIGQWLGVAVGMAWIFKNLTTIEFKINPQLQKNLLVTSFPLFIGWVFTVLYNNQTILILSSLGFAHKEIGLFAGSAKLIDAIRPLPVLFSSALFPILSEAAFKDRKMFFKLSQHSFQYFLLLLLPFILLASQNSNLICSLVFGKDFGPTGGVFEIAIWGFYAIFLNHILLQILIAGESQKSFLKGSILVALVNFVFCLLLIPRMGIIGGGWALFAGELILLTYLLGGVHRLLKPDGQSFLKSSMPSIILTIGTGLVFFTLDQFVNHFLATLITFSLFSFFMIKYNLVDLKYFKRLIK